MKIHCKPCYNFQSVEFDFDVGEDEKPDPAKVSTMLGLYKALVEALMDIAPEQGTAKPRQAQPREELATQKQLAILDKFGIRHDANITRKEASRLIDESIQSSLPY